MGKSLQPKECRLGLTTAKANNMKLPTRTQINKTFSSNSQQTKECFFSKGKTNQRNLIVSNYSYPERAIIRELTANARDAHIQAGQTKPIKLTVKNNSDQKYITKGFWFEIRDYGNGVSKEYLDNEWCEIGLSTKSESNDQVGAFGIGRMTPFCLAESFSITTFQDGKAHSYVMSENSSGVFQNTFLGTRDTNEENGLKIQFQTNKGRINPEHFFNVLFLDVPLDATVDGQKIKIQNHSDYSWHGDDYSLSNRGGFVIYGGIAYEPVYTSYLGGSPLNVTIPLGELEVSSSREALSRTTENCEIIKKYQEKAKNNIKKSIQAKLNTCSSRKEAFKLYYDLVMRMPNGTLNTALYQGERLLLRTKNNYQSYVNSLSEETCWDNRVGNIRLEPDINGIIIDDDKYSARNYIKAAELEGLVVVAKHISVEDFAKELCLDEKDILLSSTLVEQTKEYLKEKRKSRKSSTTGPNFGSAKYFSYNGNFSGHYVKGNLTPVSKPEKYIISMDKYQINKRVLLSSYNDIATLPAFSIVRESQFQKLIDSGKCESLYDKATQEIEKQSKNVLRHIKRANLLRTHEGRLIKFLYEECGWKKLKPILEKMQKSEKICAKNAALVKSIRRAPNQSLDYDIDFGIIERLPYNVSQVRPREKEDLKALYKQKYGETKNGK